MGGQPRGLKSSWSSPKTAAKSSLASRLSSCLLLAPATTPRPARCPRRARPSLTSTAQTPVHSGQWPAALGTREARSEPKDRSGDTRDHASTGHVPGDGSPVALVGYGGRSCRRGPAPLGDRNG